MKTIQHLLFLLLVTASVALHAQTSWSTAGNNPSANGFIGTTSPRPLVMKTNGTERLTIDPSGTVLIKGLAAADTSALVVMADGSLGRASDPGNGGADCNLLLWDGDGNAATPDCFIGTTNAVPFRIHTKGVERMRVTPEGHVVVQGFGAKAAFQVFDHMGVTFNRHDLGVADVYRSIGFNLYQDGVSQYHYQTGTAAKMEFVSASGLLQLSVAPSQSHDAQASFPAGIQLDQYGRAGIAARPDAIDALTVGGVTRISQSGSGNDYLRLGHDGGNAFVQAVGGDVALRSSSGMVSVEQSGNTNNYLRFGHDGYNAVMEIGGGANARLTVNRQSGKLLEVGGIALFDQSVGIGTANFTDNTTGKDYRLCVNGRIRATELRIYSGWADHVFGSDYRLMPLSEVETYISVNGHLPNMPSAVEVAQNGVDVGATQALLLEKIEELTLHLISLEKENVALQRQVNAMLLR